jgi:hypothetical protein
MRIYSPRGDLSFFSLLFSLLPEVQISIEITQNGKEAMIRIKTRGGFFAESEFPAVVAESVISIFDSVNPMEFNHFMLGYFFMA